MEVEAHSLVMDLLNVSIARDSCRRALLGARLDDPVVPDSPSLFTRARRALARIRGRRPAYSGANKSTVLPSGSQTRA
jgi:hypothetical protein